LIKCLIVTPDSRWIISGSNDKSIKITDFQTHKTVHHFTEVSSELVDCLALTSEGRFLIAGCTKDIRIFDLQIMQQVYHVKETHQSIIFKEFN